MFGNKDLLATLITEPMVRFIDCSVALNLDGVIRDAHGDFIITKELDSNLLMIEGL